VAALSDENGSLNVVDVEAKLVAKVQANILNFVGTVERQRNFAGGRWAHRSIGWSATRRSVRDLPVALADGRGVGLATEKVILENSVILKTCHFLFPFVVVLSLPGKALAIADQGCDVNQH
jgi:hypothetical protein